MSRWLVAFLLLSVLFSPLIENSEAEIGDFTIVSPDELIIHDDETVQAWFTINNRATQQRQFTIEEPMNLPNNITSNSFPLNVSLDPGEVRKIFYELSATSPLHQTSWFHVNFIEQSTSQNITYHQMITVANYSNLQFGVSGISSFNVQPNTRTSVAVNITNLADTLDNVTFSLWSMSSWNYGWQMNDTNEGLALLDIEAGALQYVYFYIEVPGVIDGSPLSGEGPRFELKAISGIDRQEQVWRFDLAMDEFSNMTIDNVEETLALNPGESSRLRLEIRNTGNIPTLPNLNLQLLDENGEVNQESEPADRHITEGWTVAIFGGLEFQTLQPNETRTVEIGFQAPNQNSGNLSVKFNLQPGNQYWKSVNTTVTSEIRWDRSASISILSSTCQQIILSEPCEVRMNVTNTGNFYDEFTLSESDFPNWASIIFSDERLSLGSGSSEIITVRISNTDLSLPAFTQNNVSLQLALASTGSNIETVTTPLKIAPFVDWVFEDVVEELDSTGTLSISMTLRNEGNLVDGLIVNLQSSHFTEMGFIPPQGAVYDEDAENIRYFEMNDIQIGANFTLRAYVEVPDDQQSNGTLYVNTTVRSKFVPLVEFVESSQTNYTGEQWRVDEKDPFIDLEAVFSSAIEIVKGWWFFTTIVIASIFLIRKGIRDRIERTEDRRLQEEMHKPKEISTDPNDWLSGFEKKQTQNQVVQTENKASLEEYQKHFQTTSKQQLVTPQINDEVREAAKNVIDHHSNTINNQTLDNLAEDILKGNVAKPHLGNQSLQPAEGISERVIRHDPSNIIRSAINTASNIPLPDDELSMIDLDDFEL